MSSIIEGYNYDIFISYRLRDNKGEKWVSEFVEALRTELESTFKEDISIYYDENPHDGLLETNDVDASLREKLKCLIFIPIISRIYCDEKAFAWVHEFKPFVELASGDRFGLKVTIPNGNVSTRVLPIRIHDLDHQDVQRCESLLGTVLRGVDFIYKSPGVNRPLRANEDHPKDNINKTYYRDQINKVANAIGDILSSLKSEKTRPWEGDKATSGSRRRDLPGMRERIRKAIPVGRSGKSLIYLLLGLVIIASGYFIFRKIYSSNNEKSFALISLQNKTYDTILSKAANEFNLVLYQKFSILKNINLKNSYWTERFLEKESSFKNIRNELNANYILTGSLIRNNKTVTILFQLSETDDSRVLWNKTVTWDSKQVSANSNEIVRSVSKAIGVQITDEEEKQLDIEFSDNPANNLKILEAEKKLNDAWDYYNYDDRLLDSASFSRAILSYDKIINDEPTALAYAKRAIARSWGYYLRELDSTNIVKCREDINKALSLDSTLSEIDVAQGFYFYYILDQNEKALEYFEKASLKDPGNYKPLLYMVIAHRRLGNWSDCRRLLHDITRLNPKEALFLTNIGITYAYLHNYDSAILCHQKAIDMIPQWTASYANKFDAMIMKNGISTEASHLLDEAVKKTGNRLVRSSILLNMYSENYREALKLAESSALNDYEILGEKYMLMAKLNGVLNNKKDELKNYESVIERVNLALSKSPGSCFNHSMLAIAYAGLGKKQKAIDEAQEAFKMAHVKNRVDESEVMMYRAEVYVMLGMYDEAYPIVSYLLNNPSYLSANLLRLDPVWKPLLDIKKYRNKLL